MRKTALIMAGGRGERFWPRSRTELPKQFISLTEDGKTMLQLTVERILPLVAMEDILVVTNERYRHLAAEQLPELPAENILTEPVGRNTAPCIGLGAVHIRKKYEDAVMFVLPSDHLIKDQTSFRTLLAEAGALAEEDQSLITIGIRPEYPETGYGYIRYDPHMKRSGAYLVEKFVEKPDPETARTYVEDGRYLWNSGMFAWKASSILKSLEAYMPDSYPHLERIERAIGTPEEQEILRNEFPLMESQSIDYGVMEKSDSIYTFPGDFGWDDVGSWRALERIRSLDEHGNTLEGNFITVDTKGCILQGSRKLIAAVGLEDLIVVDTEDATLICRKDRAGDIKKVLEKLRESGHTETL